MMSRCLVLMLALCAAPMVAGEVYRWVDGDGNVIFSDTPRDGAEKVELGETTVVPATKVPKPPPPGLPAPPGSEPVAYGAIAIAQPANEETLRNLEGVQVSVAVQPALQVRFGHKVQLFLDGKPIGRPAQKTSFVLPEVNRGAHELQAAIVDRSGKELLRSPVLTFYLQRTSVQLPPAGGPPGLPSPGGASAAP